MKPREPRNPQEPDPRRSALLALVLIVLLIVGGLYVVHVLRSSSELQDCVMSGRTNCAPIPPR
jgi:LPS O-antigen subunit length determinant protein (WzzB/FepE family)